MASKIIQWNCNGFFAHIEEIKQLIQFHDPIIICIQESRLLPRQTCKLKNYNIYRTDYTGGLNASGGTLIGIKISLHSEEFMIRNDNIQATAVKITFNTQKVLYICNIYLPPRKFAHGDLLDVISQIPKPNIILGDFNAHSQVWGSETTDTRGDFIEKTLCDNQNLSLLNNGHPTHLTISTGKLTAIDLSFCSPDLILDTKWKVMQDLCWSDHFPIIITLNQSQRQAERAPKWLTNKADWQKFQQLTQLGNPSDIDNLDTAVEKFNNLLVDAAKESMPISPPITKHPTVPWWSQEIKTAIDLRKKALKKYKNTQHINDLIDFKKKRSAARRLIRERKKESWEKLISSINCYTPANQIWNGVRSIMSKRPQILNIHLKENDELIQEPQEVAERFLTHYTEMSSTQNYQAEFQQSKMQAELITLDLESDNTEDYNKDITYDEIQYAIQQQKSTSPGFDSIHPEMLKHLTASTTKHLLSIFQHIWKKHEFPSDWRKAIIIPIPKNNNKMTPESYRPIALTSCICKLMERIVKNRLQYQLDLIQAISPRQTGFRKNRSTVDHLINLEDEITRGFHADKSTYTIFFDLKKAFDMVWKGT